MKSHPKVDAFIESIEAEFKDVLTNSMLEFGTLSGSEKAKSLIVDSMLYSLNAGGKRIRPRLLLEMCLAYSGDIERAKPFALAIEMIHTYSLIHDDLPSMDDDDLRRGKPTNHKVFGEDIAILSGDALLNFAHELMITSALNQKGDMTLLSAAHEISKAAGVRGMILGQVADIKYHNDSITTEILDFINANKTGKLLTAAIVSGGIIGGANDKEVELLRSIGYDMGLLFQIVDDVLDVIGDEAVIGKRIQNDVQNHKKTYPGLLGLEGAQTEVRKLSQEIEKKIDRLSIDPSFLKSLNEFLVKRNY